MTIVKLEENEPFEAVLVEGLEEHQVQGRAFLQRFVNGASTRNRASENVKRQHLPEGRHCRG